MVKLSLIDVKLQSKVKRANQRLRELEKKDFATVSTAYEYVKTKAFDYSNLFKRTKKNEIKFTTSISKLSKNEKDTLTKFVNEFLTSQTSKIKGIRKIEKSYKTYIKNKKSKMTFKEYGEFWKSGLIQKAKSKYKSDEVELIRETIENENISLLDIEDILKNGGLTSGYDKLNDIIDTYSKNKDIIKQLNEVFNINKQNLIKDLFKTNINGDLIEYYNQIIKPNIDMFNVNNEEIQKFENLLGV